MPLEDLKKNRHGKMLNTEQRDKAIQWFNSLNGHFGQTYIMLLAPRGLVELNPPHRASILARGGVAKITNEDGFISWLYHTYIREIEAHNPNLSQDYMAEEQQ